jgi:hypothetical protein
MLELGGNLKCVCIWVRNEDVRGMAWSVHIVAGGSFMRGVIYTTIKKGNISNGSLWE